MYAAVFQTLVNNLINTFAPYVDTCILKSILKSEIKQLEDDKNVESPLLLSQENNEEIKKYCEGCTYNIANQQAHYGGCMDFEEE
jgi:hypothetical protein